jgi:hypothetical protein
MLIGIIQFIIWLALMVLCGIGLVCALLPDPITMRKEIREKVEEERKNRENALTNSRKYAIINTEIKKRGKQNV